MIEAIEEKVSRWVLTEEGTEVAREGSHEARVFNVVPPVGRPGIQQSKIMVLFILFYCWFSLLHRKFLILFRHRLQLQKSDSAKLLLLDGSPSTSQGANL